MSTSVSDLLDARSFADESSGYTLKTRVGATVVAALVGIGVAGFWNPRLVDGFGRDVIATPALGDTTALSTTFAQNGFGFGFVFAAIAGLAATLTACNCVAFAMMPGLAAAGGHDARRSLLRALLAFTAGVTVVGLAYGMFIGALGPQGIAAFNAAPVRRAQATSVFTIIGVLMLVWAAIELGFAQSLTARLTAPTRAFFAIPTVKAGLLGLLVGGFMVGRPYPISRAFLTYAASAGNPLYGALVMIVQGLGQIAVMVALFLAITYGTRGRVTQWMAARPDRSSLIMGVALVAGGAFFIFYWGLAFTYGIGRWGFRLGWYA